MGNNNGLSYTELEQMSNAHYQAWLEAIAERDQLKVLLEGLLLAMGGDGADDVPDVEAKCSDPNCTYPH